MRNKAGGVVAAMMALALAGDDGVGELPEGEAQEAPPVCRCPMHGGPEAYDEWVAAGKPRTSEAQTGGW